MKTKDLKKRLKQERNTFIPDIKEQIYANVGFKPKRRNWNIKWSLSVSLAMMLFVFIGLQFFNNTSMPIEFDNTYVVIEINPALELELDEQERVTDVRALNLEATLLIADNHFVGQDVKVVISSVIDYAIELGYIDPEDQNSQIHINVIDSKQHKESIIDQNIYQYITNFMTTHNFKTSIIRTDNNQARVIANRYNITVGHAIMIERAMKADSSLTYKQAIRLPIKELNEMARTSQNDINDFNQDLKTIVDSLRLKKDTAIENVNTLHWMFTNKIVELQDKISQQVDLEMIVIELQEFLSEYIDDFNPIFNNYQELEEFLEFLQESVDQQLELTIDLIENKFTTQINAFRIVVANNIINNNIKFDFEFDEDFSMKDFRLINPRNIAEEREVFRIINQVQNLMRLVNNNHPQKHRWNQQINKAMNNYNQVMESGNLSDQFKSSQIIIEFEKQYQEFITSSP